MIVEGCGPLDAKIILIGEAPGKDEERTGTPFIGAAGKLLNACLSDVGIIRSLIRIENVFKVRPPNNEIGAFFRDSKNINPIDERLPDIDNLWRIIDSINPNIVVLLGATPLRVLADKDLITKRRGSVILTKPSPHSGRQYKAIPTIHPSAAIRQGTESKGGKKQYQPFVPLIKFDLMRVLEQSKFPETKTIPRYYVTRPSYEQAIDDLEQLIFHKRPVSYDIETLGNRRVSCIGFSDIPYTAFSIPFLDANGNYWTQTEEKEMWKLIATILQDPDIPKIGQFAFSFDAAILAREIGIVVKNLWIDTAIAHHEQYPEFRKGLDIIASLYTDEPYYKEDLKVWNKIQNYDLLWEYNCKDADVTLRAALELERQLKEGDYWHGFQDSMALTEPLMAATLKGIRIDKEVRNDLRTRFERRRDENQDKLNVCAGEEINVKSSVQLQKYLYGRLGLPIKISRKTRRPTADESALVQLARTTGRDEPKLILEVRKDRTFLERYAEMVLDPYDDRLRCSFNIAGTVTWRLSSDQSPFGSGSNLQNIPTRGEYVEIRKTFVPDPGFVFIEADLAQAEDRVVAWLSRSDIRMAMFNENRDGHWELAIYIFGLEPSTPYDSSNKDLWIKRYIAKRVRHATNYGMGPRRFATELAKEGFFYEEKECKRMLYAARASDPAIEMWHRSVQDQLRSSRTLTTPLGKRRYFYGRWGDDLFREGYAFIPQSTVGCLTNFGLRAIYGQLCGGREADLLLQVHDSVLIQVREDLKDRYAERMKDCMAIPLNVNGLELTIPVDVKVGKNWGEMKEVGK